MLAFQEPIAGESAKLTVVRDEGAIGGVCYFGFWIDGKLAARIDKAEVVRFTVPAGKRRLKAGVDPQGQFGCNAGASNWTQRETTLDNGEFATYRIKIGENGVFDVMRAD